MKIELPAPIVVEKLKRFTGSLLTFSFAIARREVPVFLSTYKLELVGATIPVKFEAVVTLNSNLDTALISPVIARLCTGVELNVAVPTLSSVKAPLIIPPPPVLPKKNR